MTSNEGGSHPWGSGRAILTEPISQPVVFSFRPSSTAPGRGDGSDRKPTCYTL